MSPASAPGSVTLELSPPTKQLRCDAARNRERVLGAAMHMYGERGTAFTMEEVAARAGVGIGTVYRRFPTKEALLDAVARPGFEQLLALARAAANTPEPGDGLDLFLRSAAEHHAAQGVRFRRLWDSSVARPIRDAIADVIGQVVNAAQRAGRCRADIVPRDVVVILWTVASLIDITGGSAPAVWRRHLDLVLDGLRPGGPRPPATPPVSDDDWGRLIADAPLR